MQGCLFTYIPKQIVRGIKAVWQAAIWVGTEGEWYDRIWNSQQFCSNVLQQ